MAQSAALETSVKNTLGTLHLLEGVLTKKSLKKERSYKKKVNGPRPLRRGPPDRLDRLPRPPSPPASPIPKNAKYFRYFAFALARTDKKIAEQREELKKKGQRSPTPPPRPDPGKLILGKIAPAVPGMTFREDRHTCGKFDPVCPPSSGNSS